MEAQPPACAGGAAATASAAAPAPPTGPELDALQAKIAEQGSNVAALKKSGGDAAAVKAEVAVLLALKAQLPPHLQQRRQQQGKKKKKGGGGGGGGGAPDKSRDRSTQKYVAKTPLGMRDYKPPDMAVRAKVFDTVTRVFKRHGAVTIDTPVMELKETLTGKYGEDSKLIYDLADQGGEILALRYDLTVPFARFCAQHAVRQIKRYQIARVYRRDRPVMAKGRYREFYQCDFDIAGEYAKMFPDAECIKIVTEILTELKLGDFVVKVNHRKLLDGIFAVCGVEPALFRPICSAVDKLDKEPWETVRAEMIEKGLEGECADKIWGYVQRKGGLDLVAALLADEALIANKDAKSGVEEMGLFLKYCALFGVPDKHISFDLSLARGLDYYTGVIYEAVLRGAGVGSVAGGGRYDNLVGMFSKKGRSTPCVGVSLGIERLFSVVEAQAKKKGGLAKIGIRTLPTEAYVVCGQGLLDDRMKVCAELWAANISAETPMKPKPKLLSQFQFCEDEGVPVAVVIGTGELERGVVKLRNSKTREEVEVPRAELGQRVRALLDEVKAAAAAEDAAAEDAEEAREM